MKVKEIIVVEGRDDTVAIKRAVNADTIETNGSAVNDSIIEQVRHAQKARGVIIFTDPDYPGQRIRNILSQAVPGCKHAFLPKKEAIPSKGKGLGVEHASIEAIQHALMHIKEEMEETLPEIELDDLVREGLIGHPLASERRERLGTILKIGYTNGKQLLKRLRMFQISRMQFEQALRQVIEEEQIK